MPLLWRYLVFRFFKYFLLVSLSFIFIILIFRLNDIARFAAIDGNLGKTLLFTAYQMPYVVPFALAFACLISSYYLTHHLSLSQELTSLRASGACIAKILLPIVCISFFLGAFNFIILSEITPLCRGKTEQLLYSTVRDNPLQLFRKKKFLKLKNSFIDMKLSENGEEANDLLIAFLDPSKQALSLILMKSLSYDKPFLHGSGVTTLSSLKSASLDPGLMIENYQSFDVLSKEVTSLLKKEKKGASEEQLSTKQLWLKFKIEKSKIGAKCIAEIKKRFFFFLLPITFTFLGLLWGLRLGRNDSKRASLLFCLLFLTVFLGYFGGKSLSNSPILASVCFFSVHPATLLIGIKKLISIERGIESC